MVVGGKGGAGEGNAEAENQGEAEELLFHGWGREEGGFQWLTGCGILAGLLASPGPHCGGPAAVLYQRAQKTDQPPPLLAHSQARVARPDWLAGGICYFAACNSSF
ncbi:hypothetical protein GCM10027048_19450 [Hymenobacter coalescens]